jgi:hypothetical protein
VVGGRPLPSDRLPVVFLVDSGWTTCLRQVTDGLMEVPCEHNRWQAPDELCLRGEIGSRMELAQLVAWLPPEREPVAATAAAQPHHPTFVDFVALTRELGVEVEVVSDWYGFYGEPALDALGVRGLPISSASTTWDSGRPEITFPLGHSSCFMCGTCKREQVLRHRGAA